MTTRSRSDAAIAQQGNAVSVSAPPVSAKPSVDDLVEAVSDPRFVSALSAALMPSLAITIEDLIAKRMGPVLADIAGLWADNARLDQSVRDLTAKVAKLAADSIQQATDVSAHQLQIAAKTKDHESRVEELELYGRSHDLVIPRVPESPSYADAVASATDGGSGINLPESQDVVVGQLLDLFNSRLGVSVTATDIAVAHRLRKGKADAFRRIIVQFNARKVRDNVLRAKKKLFVARVGGSGSTSGASNTAGGPGSVSTGGIFISEHLTRAASLLFFEARRLVKDRKLASAWTYKGLVNFKLSLTQERPFIAREMADFGRARTV